MPSMPSPGVYVFEAIEADLPFMPLAARRALDALGRKMSLEAWLSLSLADRQRICQAGARRRSSRRTFSGSSTRPSLRRSR